MSVLPYLKALHLAPIPDADTESFSNAENYYNLEEAFDINEEDFEQFSAQLQAAGYPSSSGSIARLNELTINSTASKASKSSKRSLRCK